MVKRAVDCGKTDDGKTVGQQVDPAPEKTEGLRKQRTIKEGCF